VEGDYNQPWRDVAPQPPPMISPRSPSLAAVHAMTTGSRAQYIRTPPPGVQLFNDNCTGLINAGDADRCHS
jgi:hypothetical protein